MRTLGYARVSSEDQNLDMQRDALKRAGCEEPFYEEKISSAAEHRPELERVMADLRQGDTLVVWRLDRLGRNTRQRLELLDKLRGIGVDLVSVTDHIDTRGPMGRLFYTISAAFAECERETIRERTRAGLEAARARGRSGGRPPVLSQQAILQARQMYESKQFTVAQIAETFRCSRVTIYRAVGYAF